MQRKNNVSSFFLLFLRLELKSNDKNIKRIGLYGVYNSIIAFRTFVLDKRKNQSSLSLVVFKNA